MTVLISKPAINLRGELTSLKKPSGIVGESILRADTAAEAVEQLDLEDHTFTTFTSTGIDDNATSTKLTVSATGIDVTGTVTADGLSVDGNVTVTGDEIIVDSSTQAFLKLDRGENDSHYALTRYYTSGTEEWRTGTYNDSTSSFYIGNPTSKRLSITTGGDISFYEGTGTTPKFFWDASAESLGIGTSSPRAELDVSGSVLIGTYQTASNYAPLSVKTASTITTPSTFTNAVNIWNGTTVGGYSNITFGYNTLGLTNAAAYMGFVSTSSSGNGKGDFVFGTRDVTTDTAATERMRIDSSGNVLVGTTAVPTDDNVALGFGVTSSGEVRASVNGANAAMFKRATSDGDIVEFRKDSIKVGSIGYSSSNGFYMHTPFGNDSGLVFGSERIVPCTSSGAFDDAVVDLGYSSGRFKDLYLSGGVVFNVAGGTGTSTSGTLDDYEEGTWTPTALNYDGTMTVTSATYVKVGKLVTVKANVSFDATADGSGVNISGLPFTTTGTAKANGGFVTSSTVSSAARVQAVGTSSLFLTATDNSNVTYTTMSSTTLEFIMIYEAA